MISKVSNWNKGFTLIELLIALALIGLIMGLVVGQARKLSESSMKHSANRLAATIRYLYNKAASEGITLRLVIDLEESKYWIEKTTKHVTLEKEETTGPGTRDQGLRTKKKKEEKTEDGEQKSEATFSPEESYLAKGVTLPKGVYFKDVYAEHQVERLSKGEAFIYFFPQGYVERSVINLRDSDDKVHYSLEVNPISGAVAIERGYKEPEVGR